MRERLFSAFSPAHQRRYKMKWNWICGVIFAAALAMPAPAQISVYIGHPPPRVRYERRGRFPVRATPGSMATGRRRAVDISGYRGAGTVRPIRGRAGFVPAISISTRAGSYRKATGTMTNMVTAAIAEGWCNLKTPKNCHSESRASSREESAATLPAQSRFLADRPGFGMTSCGSQAKGDCQDD